MVVLWAARLVPEKGADLFADAFVALFNNKTLLEHYPGVIDRIRIVVVGSGPSRAQMEAALPPDRTVFFGHLVGDELRAAYASSDVYFFPSHTEAFPNTLLEAQASGLAVLAASTREDGSTSAASEPPTTPRRWNKESRVAVVSTRVSSCATIVADANHTARGQLVWVAARAAVHTVDATRSLTRRAALHHQVVVP